jgi:beta-1,4-mannosyltransferase
MRTSPEGLPLRVLASPSATGADGNPYIDLLYRDMRAAGADVQAFDRRALLRRPQIVHVHWPAALVRWDALPQAVGDVLKVLGGLWVARRRGARLVWTGHDLEPHEVRRPGLHRVYFALFTRMVDLWISLTEAGAAQLRQRYPLLAGRPARVIAHGSYRDAYAAAASRSDADAQLGLVGTNGPSFLLLGQIRRYKNALPLLQAFTAAPQAGERLLIAGEVRSDERLGDELRAAASDREDVVLRLEKVRDPLVAAWHAAADVVVLPYDPRSALNSGALMLALSFDTPVVVADTPINRELREAVGENWVHLFIGGAADALALARRVAGASRSGRPELSAFEWPGIVSATVDAYRAAEAGR